MTTQAKIGHGVLFKIGNGATPEVFTTVAEVTSIGWSGITRDSIDATHEESPDAYREFVEGLKDAGEVTIELNFVPGSATTALLLAEAEAATGNKQIVWTTGHILSMRAFQTGFEPGDMPLDDKMTATATYKVTGKPTFV